MNLLQKKILKNLIVAEASGMAQKIVTRTSFEATRDLARSDNTTLLGAAPLPKGHIKARNRWIHCELPPGAANNDLTGCGGQSGRVDPWRVDPCHFGIAEEFFCLRQKMHGPKRHSKLRMQSFYLSGFRPCTEIAHGIAPEVHDY